MKIEILEFVEGAKRAKGMTVIIDVFRAFSVACYAFDAGAVKLIATGMIEDAFELKKSRRSANAFRCSRSCPGTSASPAGQA